MKLKYKKMQMGAKLTRGGLVIINFMYQFGWAKVPRDSGCLCEGVFRMRLTFKFVNFG